MKTLSKIFLAATVALTLGSSAAMAHNFLREGGSGVVVSQGSAQSSSTSQGR